MSYMYHLQNAIWQNHGLTISHHPWLPSTRTLRSSDKLLLSASRMTLELSAKSFQRWCCRFGPWLTLCTLNIALIHCFTCSFSPELTFTLLYRYWDSQQFRYISTRQSCYRKDDRAMRPINRCPENFRDSLTTPTATFPKIFHGLLFRSTLWMWVQNLKSVYPFLR